MSAIEKFVFLGSLTLAVIVMSQAPPETGETDLNTGQDTPESPALSQPTEQPAIAATPSVMVTEPAPVGYLKTLTACPGMSTAHAADVDQKLDVEDFKPQILVNNKVRLATAPVGGGCYSSPFGMRNGRLHKGVDYYSKVAVPVFAAGAGKIRKREYRSDYGNMIVIDHGDGVYTRYAHLESFAGVDVGDRVSAGQEIGIMGHTAGYKVPRHLHYEILTGTWSAQAGSFALTPIDPMAQPAP